MKVTIQISDEGKKRVIKGELVEETENTLRVETDKDSDNMFLVSKKNFDWAKYKKTEIDYVYALMKAKEFEKVLIALDSNYGPLKELAKIIELPLRDAIEHLKKRTN